MRHHHVRSPGRLAYVVATALVAASLATVATPAPPAAAEPIVAPTTVTLAAGATTLGSQDSTTVTATADASVTGTGLYITIFDRATAYAITSCGSGSTCSATRTFND